MKNALRISFAVLVSYVILLSCIFTCYAEDVTYEIDDINMSITVPDTMLAITRDSQKDDKFFKEFEVDYISTMDNFTNGNIYFQAMEKDSSLTLTVTMTTTEDSQKIDTYHSITEDQLNDIKKTFLQDGSYKSCSVKEYNGVSYLCLMVNTKTDGKTVQAQQFNTVMNGSNYVISLQSKAGKKLNADDKALFDKIMQTVSIVEKNFFTENGEMIMYTGITLFALIVVVVAFIVLIKYIKNPIRKNKNILHELAHEHQISETTQIPRERIDYLINENLETQNDFMQEYEPLEEIGGGKKTAPTSAKTSVAVSSQAQVQEEAVVIPENQEEFDGGTDYFSSVPEEKDMYSYSDVETAVDDYSIAKREEARRKRRETQQTQKEVNLGIKFLKAIGFGIIKFFQILFMVIAFIIIHCKYFCINFYRLIKRKNAQRKRKKIEEEKRARATERRRQQQEAEMRRRKRNENRGENELIKVRARGEVRTYDRNSYRRRSNLRSGSTSHSSKRY